MIVIHPYTQGEHISIFQRWQAHTFNTITTVLSTHRYTIAHKTNMENTKIAYPYEHKSANKHIEQHAIL